MLGATGETSANVQSDSIYGFILKGIHTPARLRHWVECLECSLDIRLASVLTVTAPFQSVERRKSGL